MKFLILLVAIFALSIAIPIQQKGKQLPPPPTWPPVKSVSVPPIGVTVFTFTPDINAKKEVPTSAPDDLPIDQGDEGGYKSSDQIIPDDFTDFPAIIDHN